MLLLNGILDGFYVWIRLCLSYFASVALSELGFLGVFVCSYIFYSVFFKNYIWIKPRWCRLNAGSVFIFAEFSFIGDLDGVYTVLLYLDKAVFWCDWNVLLLLLYLILVLLGFEMGFCVACGLESVRQCGYSQVVGFRYEWKLVWSS